MTDRVVFEEYLDPAPAVALAGLLGSEAPQDELPLLWHWVYLLARPRQESIGPDGHPLDGVPAPPGAGMRRMFAGGSARSLRPLRLGEPARRTTELVSTTVREGRSGRLTFAAVRSTIEQADQIAVIEDQTIVYREAPASTAQIPQVTVPAVPVATPEGGVLRDFAIDPVLLFRFSALTYNSHRIHYDREYATTVEGYPGLVVHGPLQALLMLDAAAKLRGARPTSFEFRLSAPSFDFQPLRILAEPIAGVSELTTSVLGPEGRAGATGTAGFGPQDQM
jgi:3-methylfumaryl-CoA hydratase